MEMSPITVDDMINYKIKNDTGEYIQADIDVLKAKGAGLMAQYMKDKDKDVFLKGLAAAFQRIKGY